MPITDKHIITQEEILSLFNEKKRYICIADSYVKDTVVAEEMVSQCLFQLMLSKDSQYVHSPKTFFRDSYQEQVPELPQEKKEGVWF